jgi:hypothetical protein
VHSGILENWLVTQRQLLAFLPRFSKSKKGNYAYQLLSCLNGCEIAWRALPEWIVSSVT